MEGRTVLMNTGLMHAQRLRSCYGKRWAQTGNQSKYECDSQFHIASIAADRTRERDARIHEFVVFRVEISLHDNRDSCFLE